MFCRFGVGVPKPEIVSYNVGTQLTAQLILLQSPLFSAEAS